MFQRYRVPVTALQQWLADIGPDGAFGALTELIPQAAVMVVDADRNVVLWNETAEELVGFKAEEAVGSHCLKSHRCVECMGGCGIERHRAVTDVPLKLTRADGSRVRVRKTARAFFDDEGRFAGGIELLIPDRSPAPEGAAASPATEATSFHGLVSRDPAMLRVFQTIRNVAETEATILVRGESGTGKELVARAIHAESHRRDKPFVAVNCAALTPTLLESELFGHVRGAFTGAVRDRAGLFEEADGGTLFLDEVAELSMEVQAKLLRVLEERAVVRVGDTKSLPVDVRIISATHRALRKEVERGKFREDLMFRLRVVPLFLPTLRERRNDLQPLLRHFIDSFNERGPRRVESIAPEAMRLLMDHPWQGNVREMKNVVEYAFAVGRGAELDVEDLPIEFREGMRDGAPAPDTKVAAGGNEKRRIQEAIKLSDGHLGKAAELLGMSRATFWRKRSKYGL
jgi:PAS domain S-box-containing protein